MIVPKLFRLLFFGKKVTTTFDAIRNPEAIYVDTSLYLEEIPDSFKNNLRLTDGNFHIFIKENDKNVPYILFGNNPNQLTKFQNALENEGFTFVYNVGSLEDLKEVDKQKI